MSSLVLYGLAVLVVALITVGVLRWRWDTPLRCGCGREATRLASDGLAECDVCLERRIGARAPRGG